MKDCCNAEGDGHLEECPVGIEEERDALRLEVERLRSSRGWAQSVLDAKNSRNT